MEQNEQEKAKKDKTQQTIEWIRALSPYAVILTVIVSLLTWYTGREKEQTDRYLNIINLLNKEEANNVSIRAAAVTTIGSYYKRQDQASRVLAIRLANEDSPLVRETILSKLKQTKHVDVEPLIIANRILTEEEIYYELYKDSLKADYSENSKDFKNSDEFKHYRNNTPLNPWDRISLLRNFTISNALDEKLSVTIEALANILDREDNIKKKGLDLSKISLCIPDDNLTKYFRDKLVWKQVNLKNAILANISLKESNLIGGNLKNAYLYNVDLTNADLEDVDLSYTHLERVKMKNANLANTNLTGATLSDMDLDEANLLEANLTDADFDYSAIKKAKNWQDAIFSPGVKEKLTKIK